MPLMQDKFEKHLDHYKTNGYTIFPKLFDEDMVRCFARLDGTADAANADLRDTICVAPFGALLDFEEEVLRRA